MKEEKSDPKTKIRGFRPDKDVADMLDKAVASGETMSAIVNAAVRQFGPAVLRQRAKQLRKQADAIEKDIGEDKH